MKEVQAEKKMPGSENWYEMKEAHGSFGMQIMFFLIKFLPAGFLRLLAFPVGFCYFLFARKARALSRLYLARRQDFARQAAAVPAAAGQAAAPGAAAASAGPAPGAPCIPQAGSTLKHIVSFALLLTEKVAVWAGKFSFKQVSFAGEDVRELQAAVSRKQGCLIIISHAGNSELLRALVDADKTGLTQPLTVHVVYDMEISGGFVSLLHKVNSRATFNTIDANRITPQTIAFMQERLAAGDCIAIAGDRTGAHSNRFITLPFLGKSARFSYGTFLLAALLDVPTYFVFGMRKRDLSLRSRYVMSACRNAFSFGCPRREREERIKKTAAAFAQELERRCLTHPYQWYNFFDFWAGAEEAADHPAAEEPRPLP